MIAQNLVIIARNFKSIVTEGNPLGRPEEILWAVEDGTCQHGTAMDISIINQGDRLCHPKQ